MRTSFVGRLKIACCAVIAGGAFALAPWPASAIQSITLAWNPSTNTDIAGYEIYYGIASGVYTNVIDVGNVTNATISGLLEGVTYYFAAKARNTSGMESDFSNEASYAVPVLAVASGSSSPVLGSAPTVFGASPVAMASGGSPPTLDSALSTSPAGTLGGAIRSPGAFSFTVNGITGYKYIIQASTDMVNWVSLQTNIAPFTFVDTKANQYPHRFYRSVYMP
jgi:hypothetical protein